MQNDNNKIMAKMNIFCALNGRDMKIADYLRNITDEELAHILYRLLCDCKNENEILDILQQPASELLNL